MPTAAPGARKPFAVISVNTPAPPPDADAGVSLTMTPSPPPRLSWTLLRQLTISLPAPGAGEFRGYPAERLEYYRFPFPELPVDARGKLSKVLSQKSMAEGNLGRGHFQKIVESWRRALLSLYQSLKSGRSDYFYYLQSDLTVLFRREPLDGSLSAFVAKASKSLVKLLKEEAVDFEQSHDHDNPENAVLPASENQSPECTPHPSSFGDVDDDKENHTMDSKTIKSLIHDRLNKARTVQSRRRSTATVTLALRGEIAVHTLIDFILNQRDGKSFVIMPELISPGPFLYGTLCKSDLSVVGPILGGEYQVRLTGTLLPLLCKDLVEQVLSNPKNSTELLSFNQTIDERTDSFLPFVCK